MKQTQTKLVQIIPFAFVILWATGFLGARYAMPYATPYAFLSIRFAITIAILLVLLFIFKSKLPKGSAIWHAMIIGVLFHGIYLGTIFWAIKNGFPAGFAGIIVGLQPIITAFLAAKILGDKITKMQILGLIVGIIGISLVLYPKLIGTTDTNIFWGAIASLFGVIAFSLGTIIQKKSAKNQNLIGNAFYQYLGALIFSLPLALLFEQFIFEWNGELIFAFFWLILVLSIGAILLLMLMIKAHEATNVASYFYLVPATTVIMAYFLFGETLNMMQIIGLLITSTGVALATVFSNKSKT